jgi:hypothetical protein
VAIEDATGDSALFEYTDGGKLHIYHGKEYVVMTNDPPIDKQVELLAEYDGFGGSLPLPGSTSSEDRFVRLSYYLPFLKKPKNDIEAIAKIHSLMMNSDVPFDVPYGMLGMGIYPTWWTSYCDITNGLYYFNWIKNPSMIWIELKNLDFSGDDVLYLDPKDPTIMGEVSSFFKKIDPTIDFGNSPYSEYSTASLLSLSTGTGTVVVANNYDEKQLQQSYSSFVILSAVVVGSAIGFFVHKKYYVTSNGRDTRYSMI